MCITWPNFLICAFGALTAADLGTVLQLLFAGITLEIAAEEDLKPEKSEQTK